jgi:methyltransferase (TIGR00027 family)
MSRLHRSAVAAFVVVSTCLASAIQPGLPSLTAVEVTLHRAIGAKNPDPQFRNPDYMAARFLGTRERALLVDAVRDAIDLDYDTALARYGNLGVLVTSHLLRTRHIDGALLDAVHAGVHQVVNLGAGFDSRAYRFAGELRDVRTFEVDYPPTQEYKKLRLKEILGRLPDSVRFVPMDFTKDDLLTQLRRSGYREHEPTFFIWEGVTYYLPASLIRATLRFVREHSGTGSSIVFDYTDDQNPNVNNPNGHNAQVGEPMIFGFAGGVAAPVVREEGLDVVADLSFMQLYDRYARLSDGTPAMPLPDPRANLAGICIARAGQQVH